MIYNGKKYVKPNYLAEKWDCSVGAIRYRIKNGSIPGCIRYKGSWYIPYDAEIPSGFKPRHGVSRSISNSRSYESWCNILDSSVKLSKLYLEV